MLNNKMLVKSNSVAIACYFGKVDAHDRVYSASYYYPYGVIAAKVTGVEIPWVKFLSSSEVAKIQVITSGNYFYFQCDDAGVIAQIGDKTCVVTLKIN